MVLDERQEHWLVHEYEVVAKRRLLGGSDFIPMSLSSSFLSSTMKTGISPFVSSSSETVLELNSI